MISPMRVALLQLNLAWEGLEVEPRRRAEDPQASSRERAVANWPEQRRAYLQPPHKAGAVKNSCYVAAVNRARLDGKVNRQLGDSPATSPRGETLVSAAEIKSRSLSSRTGAPSTTARRQAAS